MRVRPVRRSGYCRSLTLPRHAPRRLGVTHVILAMLLMELIIVAMVYVATGASDLPGREGF
ncbi:hypothetical protein [Rhizobium oryzicola]|uniref:Uncharacterized protein n=1 Tax=Rhizobium oryzicola TaxID=1232668 RepID=A0ABT8STV3_9HYPH|nr:hypothetical protein [Rhizobium oryzicola]MDO1581847.1 hypothetical protein [Rhizobium oryzicola]